MSEHEGLERLPEDERVREAVELAREQPVEWGEGRQERGWEALAEELGLQEELEEQEVQRKELWAIAAVALVLVGGVMLSRAKSQPGGPAVEPTVEVGPTEREAPRDE